MQIEWLIKEGSERLAVIVLGWACNGGTVRRIIPEGRDAVCIYDYRDIGAVLSGHSLDGPCEEILRYRYKTLIAWSFGVWAAERLFGEKGKMPLRFDKATALNGTPLPADQLYGIGPRRLAVTLRGLAKAGRETFDRKTYGPSYGHIEPLPASRGLEADVDELEALIRFSSLPYDPSLHWDEAVVGTLDEIFPPENMIRYWGSRAKEVPLYHYPFGDETVTGTLF